MAVLLASTSRVYTPTAAVIGPSGAIDLAAYSVMHVVWFRPSAAISAIGHFFNIPITGTVTASASTDGIAFGFDASGYPITRQSRNGTTQAVISGISDVSQLVSGATYCLIYHIRRQSAQTARHSVWVGKVGTDSGMVGSASNGTAVGGSSTLDSVASQTLSFFNRQNAMDAGLTGYVADQATFIQDDAVSALSQAQVDAIYASGYGTPSFNAVPAGWTRISDVPFIPFTSGTTFYDVQQGITLSVAGTPSFDTTNLPNAPRTADLTGLTVSKTGSTLKMLLECGYMVDVMPNRRICHIRDRSGYNGHRTITDAASWRHLAWMPDRTSTDIYSNTRSIQGATATGYGFYSNTNGGYMYSNARADFTTGTSTWVFHWSKQNLNFKTWLVRSDASGWGIFVETDGTIKWTDGTTTKQFTTKIAQSGHHTLTVSISHPSGITGASNTGTITVRIDDDSAGEAQTATWTPNATRQVSRIGAYDSSSDDGACCHFRQIRYYENYTFSEADHLAACQDFQTTYGTVYKKRQALLLIGSSTMQGSINVDAARAWPYWLNTGAYRVYNLSYGGAADAYALFAVSGSITNGPFVNGDSITISGGTASGSATCLAQWDDSGTTYVAVTASTATLTNATTATTLTSGSKSCSVTAASTKVSTAAMPSFLSPAVKSLCNAILAIVPSGQKAVILGQIGSNSYGNFGMVATTGPECYRRFLSSLTYPAGVVCKKLAMTPHPRRLLSTSSPSTQAGLGTLAASLATYTGSYWDDVIDYTTDSEFNTFGTGTGASPGNGSFSTSGNGGLSKLVANSGGITVTGQTVSVKCVAHGLSVGDPIRLYYNNAEYNREWAVASVVDADNFTITGVCGNPSTLSDGSNIALCKSYEKDTAGKGAHMTTSRHKRIAAYINAKLGPILGGGAKSPSAWMIGTFLPLMDLA